MSSLIDHDGNHITAGQQFIQLIFHFLDKQKFCTLSNFKRSSFIYTEMNVIFFSRQIVVFQRENSQNFICHVSFIHRVEQILCILLREQKPGQWHGRKKNGICMSFLFLCIKHVFRSFPTNLKFMSFFFANVPIQQFQEALNRKKRPRNPEYASS